MAEQFPGNDQSSPPGEGVTGNGMVPIPPGEFKGDPRRVPGHPSNPASNEIQAYLNKEMPQVPLKAEGGVSEADEITLPRHMAKIMRLQSRFPNGAMISRKSGVVEQGWRIDMSRVLDGNDSEGNPIQYELADDEVLVVSPDGVYEKPVKITQLEDDAIQKKLADEFQRQAEAAAKQLVEAAISAPLAVEPIVEQSKAEAMDARSIARSYEGVAGFGRMSREALSLLDGLATVSELSDDQRRAVESLARTVSLNNEQIAEMNLGIDTSTIHKLSMARNAKALIPELRKAVQNLSSYGVNRGPWLERGSGGAAAIIDISEAALANLLKASNLTPAEQASLHDRIAGK